MDFMYEVLAISCEFRVVRYLTPIPLENGFVV